jgi:hypothetical protein
MNFKHAFSNFITNKTILNIIIVIAVLNIVGYVALGNINAIFYFILLGLLVGNFSKNLTITLIIPLVLVNLFVMHRSYVEGFTTDGSGNQMDASNNAIQNNSNLNNAINNINKSQTDIKSAVNQINQSQTQDPKSSQGLPITPIDNMTPPVNTSQSNATTEESFEVGRSKKRNGYDIDYASTVEEAYNNLNQIIGSDGIKQLTSDTQNLMKQQLQLAEAMNSMTPMIQTMAPLLKQAQGLFGNLGGDNLGNLAKQFAPVNK